MGLKKMTTTLLFLLITSHVYAQKLEEPDECFLNTMKGAVTNGQNSAVAFYQVKRTCVLKYIREMEPRAKKLSPESFVNASLEYSRDHAGAYSSSFFKMKLKNDSNDRLMVSFVGITNKKTGKVEYVKFLAADGG